MKITFDFEKPLADLQLQIDKVKQVEEKTKVDMSATVNELEEKFESTKNHIYSHLNGWQKVQISASSRKALYFTIFRVDVR